MYLAVIQCSNEGKTEVTGQDFMQTGNTGIFDKSSTVLDPLLLQSARQMSLGKILTPSFSPMHPLEYECVQMLDRRV